MMGEISISYTWVKKVAQNTNTHFLGLSKRKLLLYRKIYWELWTSHFSKFKTSIFVPFEPDDKLPK